MTRRASGLRDSADRWSEIRVRGSTYRAECIGGLTTFLTLVYIAFVNRAILSSTPELTGCGSSVG